MASDGSSTQLTAALYVVVDHLADRVVERVMQLLEIRLGEARAAELEARGARPRRSGVPVSDSRADGPGLMTLEEAARYLNRPLASIQFYVHRTRVIAKYKIGRRVMVKREDLDALIEGGPSRSDVVSSQAPSLKREKRSVLKRRCADCETSKPLTAFGRRDGGFDTRCRRCRDAAGPSARPDGVVDLLETRRARSRRTR